MSEEKQMKHDIYLLDQLLLNVSTWQDISMLIFNTPTWWGAQIDTQEFAKCDKGFTRQGLDKDICKHIFGDYIIVLDVTVFDCSNLA